MDQIGDKNATYEDLLATLSDTEPRYIVVDYDYKSKDGRDVVQLVFIFWCPDNTQIKRKMTYYFHELLVMPPPRRVLKPNAKEFLEVMKHKIWACWKGKYLVMSWTNDLFQSNLLSFIYSY